MSEKDCACDRGRSICHIPGAGTAHPLAIFGVGPKQGGQGAGRRQQSAPLATAVLRTQSDQRQQPRRAPRTCRCGPLDLARRARGREKDTKARGNARLQEHSPRMPHKHGQPPRRDIPRGARATAPPRARRQPHSERRAGGCWLARERACFHCIWSPHRGSWSAVAACTMARMSASVWAQGREEAR